MLELFVLSALPLSSEGSLGLDSDLDPDLELDFELGDLLADLAGSLEGCELDGFAPGESRLYGSTLICSSLSRQGFVQQVMAVSQQLAFWRGGYFLEVRVAGCLLVLSQLGSQGALKETVLSLPGSS